ncbi:hypothetical protein [Bacterioplanoides pacificum]|uniref:Uncharacterized protein n=1 Tax=Bacterioplanoides pacificum TaxID=1171596 RepID=A0ABV7VQ41_9GAMM
MAWLISKAEKNQNFPETLRQDFSDFKQARENGRDCIMPGRNMALAEHYGVESFYSMKLIDLMAYPFSSDFTNGSLDRADDYIFWAQHYPYSEIIAYVGDRYFWKFQIETRLAMDALVMSLACLALDSGDYVENIDDIMNMVIIPYLNKSKSEKSCRGHWFKQLRNKVCEKHSLGVSDFYGSIAIGDEDPDNVEKRYKRWMSGNNQATETKVGELLQQLQKEFEWDDRDVMAAANAYKFYCSVPLLNSSLNSSDLGILHSVPCGDVGFKVREEFNDDFSERFKFWMMSLSEQFK